MSETHWGTCSKRRGAECDCNYPADPMTDEYTPTTDEIRDYVEVGGEPQPWLPPAPDKDAARVAAFDRWLADHDERVKAEAKAEALEEARAEFDEFSMNANEQVMPGTSGWRFVTVGEWLDNRAAAIRAAAENGERANE